MDMQAATTWWRSWGRVASYVLPRMSGLNSRLQDRQTARLRLEQRWVERVVELHQHVGWRLDGRWIWGPERFFRLSACKIARMWTMVKAMRVEVKIWSEKGLGGRTGCLWGQEGEYRGEEVTWPQSCSQSQ